MASNGYSQGHTLVSKGARNLRQRLTFATITGRSIRVEAIREDAEKPGLHSHEASLLRLLEKVTNGSVVEINETGTTLRYKPGIVVGGINITHDCGRARSIGYFLEPLILLSIFGKKPLSIVLKGITNDDLDPSVDSWRSIALPLLAEFGIGEDDMQRPLSITINKRGMRPEGGGEVFLRCPVVKSLKSVCKLDEGMVKRVRGVAYAAKTPPQTTNRMVDGARGLLNKLLADVYIFTDHMSGEKAGNSPGFGIIAIAETTSGCRICCEASSSSRARNSSQREGEMLKVPEEVGQDAVKALLEEIKRGGVVDGTQQGLILSLCALTSKDEISQIRLGPLTPYAVHTLRNIRDFFGITFKIAPEQQSQTLFLSCIGAGIVNNVKALN